LTFNCPEQESDTYTKNKFVVVVTHTVHGYPGYRQAVVRLEDFTLISEHKTTCEADPPTTTIT